MRRKLHEFESKVLRALRNGGAGASAERVLLAVSGGADSMALLHATSRIAPIAGLALAVAHLDHGLRGAESAGDAEFVRAAASDLGIPAVVAARRVVRRRGESLETAARRVRYAFLAKAAADFACARIATGHTANDQAETVLLRILRGAGPAGLSAVRARRGVAGAGFEIIRPLLECSRAEVLAYLGEIGASYRADSSNASLEPLRNRVRHEILPRAESLVNPRAVDALARFARRQGEIDRFLEAEAARALAAVLIDEGDGWVALDAAALAALAPALAPPVIRRACRRASTGAVARSLEEAHIAAVLALARGLSGRQARALPAPLHARRVGARIVIACEPARSSDHSAPSNRHAFHARLDVPGEVELPALAGAGRDLAAISSRSANVPRSPTPSAGLAPPLIRAELVSRETSTSSAPGPIPGAPPPFAVEFDWERIAPPLEVRNRQPGDRIAPRGMLGRKSLQDLFVDRKIPWTERHLVPIVADQCRVLWVVGHAVSREAAVSETTREALVLAFCPIVPGRGNR
jgi:tRNA(Ile)-lysidine synthase